MSTSNNHTDGVPALNQYLQSIGKAEALSWLDTTSGPAHAPQWTSTCKIENEAKGKGQGPQKHIARDIAAKEALKAFGVTM
ncbi:hypothetical protein PHLGIDRAFT_124620 [Phlebiopsis gigantea 11061_1 CR5-6]|uniref:DRBM domain-containing protein n=1 Tax=Phlebiopsis gigantea (strain 11061_1 CR5-6) TaxID=745531 RepID=A0A0C3P1L3_PHLG1|nr:hypothetical protein PHLGIDRAFT_124620 [Phlebiopsis gigantea 11061_1 CR5-6]